MSKRKTMTHAETHAFMSGPNGPLWLAEQMPDAPEGATFEVTPVGFPPVRFTRQHGAWRHATAIESALFDTKGEA